MSVSMIKQQMMQLLRQKNIRCAEINEIAIEAYMPGKEMETVHCIIAFGVDQLSIVDVKCQNLFNFKEKQVNGLLACSQANQASTLARFYLDEQGNVVAQMQQIYGGSIALSHALLMISLFASDVDKNYRVFGKLRWA